MKNKFILSLLVAAFSIVLLSACADDDVLKTEEAVLKTKHDTVKNSINNVR